MSRLRRTKPASHSASVPPTADTLTFLDVLQPRACDPAVAAIPEYREVSLHAFESRQEGLE